MNEGFLSRWSRRKHDSRRADDEQDTGSPAPPVPADAQHRSPSPPGADSGPGASNGAWTPGDPPEQRSAHGSPMVQGDRKPAHEVQSPAATPSALPAVESLTPQSDFRAFMQPGVDSTTRNAALAQLFRDPRYNVMDGLDVYIDDYTQPAPIPPSMLAKLKQLHAIGLSDEEIERRFSLPALAALGERDDVGATAFAAPTTETDASATDAQAGEAPAAQPTDDPVEPRTKPQEPQP